MADALVRAQCNSIFHRGPDDWGVLTDQDFGFGMRRLSILDISRGHQPITTPDGRFSIVFNGEIYNHLDVRARLAGMGHRFRTHSDTETIVHAFSEWQNDCWALLEGMFAVAIWDRRWRELTLARDPLGIKPLYISEQNSGISFASELKALRVLPCHEFTVDDRAVADYFRFGHVRRPRSIFHEVRTLDPAHYLTIGAEGRSQACPYWQPRSITMPNVSAEQWFESMRTMLVETTARHLQADVPVGAFLSGGIDSSAVLAAARRASDQPIKAFTIGYPGANIDETDAARRIARHLGCEHLALALDVSDATALLPDLVRSFDEPFADMAAIPTWFASKLAAEHVKVVLCGEGGDELFAGYKRHRNAALIERWRPAIDAIGPIRRIIGGLPILPSARLNYLRQHGQRLTEFIELPDGIQQFFAATEISRRRVRAETFDAEFLARHEGIDSYGDLEREYFPPASDPDASALEQFLLGDLTLNMPSAMLTRLDRASMAHSVEARVPFLSHKMVDWALTVPANMKLRGKTGKYLLRQAIAPWLPPDIIQRPKQGFQIPHAAWLRGSFGDFARALWHDSGASTAGYLNNRVVERLFNDHRAGTADHGRILYAIAVFALWWRSARIGAPMMAAHDA